MEDLKVYVLFRASRKTGAIDTTITGLGSAMMRMWALRNTTPSKFCLIIERDTGKVEYVVQGTKRGEFPKILDGTKSDLGTCDGYGIPIDVVQSIKDDRFDEEVV